jgi:hypothetical protein
VELVEQVQMVLAAALVAAVLQVAAAVVETAL